MEAESKPPVKPHGELAPALGAKAAGMTRAQIVPNPRAARRLLRIDVNQGLNNEMDFPSATTRPRLPDCLLRVRQVWWIVCENISHQDVKYTTELSRDWCRRRVKISVQKVRDLPTAEHQGPRATLVLREPTPGAPTSKIEVHACQRARLT